MALTHRLTPFRDNNGRAATRWVVCLSGNNEHKKTVSFLYMCIQHRTQPKCCFCSSASAKRFGPTPTTNPNTATSTWYRHHHRSWSPLRHQSIASPPSPFCYMDLKFTILSRTPFSPTNTLSTSFLIHYSAGIDRYALSIIRQTSTGSSIITHKMCIVKSLSCFHMGNTKTWLTHCSR